MSIGIANRGRSSKVNNLFIAVCDFIMTVLVEIVVFYGALSSDNRIVFFRSKSFFKSVMYLCSDHRKLSNIIPLPGSVRREVKNNFLFTMTASEQWVNCLVQGRNDRFLPCQLGDSVYLSVPGPTVYRRYPYLLKDMKVSQCGKCQEL